MHFSQLLRKKPTFNLYHFYQRHSTTVNLEFLIARRVGTSTHKSFSKAILRLAVVAIALSMVVMILATSIVAGFKNTISEKIFGFWGHIHVTSSVSPSSYAYETSPMNQTQHYYPSVDTIEGIWHGVPAIDWPETYALNADQWFLWAGLAILVLGTLLGIFLRLTWKPRLAILLGSWAVGLPLLLTPVYEIAQTTVDQRTNGGIAHIQRYIHKEGIIKTKDQIEGIVLRGVGPDYRWDFLKQYIKQGEVLDYDSEEAEKGILISETTASRLKLALGDQFLVYFVQDGSSLARKFNVQGIYKTGLEEYDRRFALVDIRTLQQLNNWRPYRSYGPVLELPEESVTLKGWTGPSAANDPTWAYISSHLLEGELLDFDRPDLAQAVLPHWWARLRDWQVGDTVQLDYRAVGADHRFRFRVQGIYQSADNPMVDQLIGVHWGALDQLNQVLPPQISGFELFVDDINDLDPFGNYVNMTILRGTDQYANTIKELETNIFDWLSLTDMNERIILLLMILVSIINMTTSLMILILERTNMIGILKALGAANWSIRKIFLYNAAYIIGYGLFWGNVLGLLLCWIQHQYGIIQLPEDLYYVATAPIELNWMTLILLNVGTLFITLTVLLVPSWLVAKIDPVKAIRFS